MKASNKNLAQFINMYVEARVRLNLKLGCLDPISIKFTRTELRGFTGSGRIENTTMARIINELTDNGYDVIGEATSENFEVILDVKNCLTNFGTLEDLIDSNAWVDEILTEKSNKVTTAAEPMSPLR